MSEHVKFIKTDWIAVRADRVVSVIRSGSTLKIVFSESMEPVVYHFGKKAEAVTALKEIISQL